MQLTVIVEQIFILALVAAAGYAAFKTKILNPETNKAVSRLVIYITLPAMLIASVADVPASVTGHTVWLLLGASFLTYALLGLIAVTAPRLIRAKREDYGVYTFMAMFGNVGFMGFPVLTAIFGEKAIFLAAIFNLPMNLICFSLGILMIAPKGTKLKATALLNPTVVASVAALLLYLLPWSLPTVVNDGFALIGQATIPLAMMLIGSSLAQLPFREIFAIPRLYLLSFVKLITCPFLIYLALRWLIKDPLLLGIATVLVSMPVATNATMLCIEYGGNELLASRGVFISTLLSLVTIPLIVAVLF